ncbi:ABC transporter permease [Cellulomonas sp. URHD0024]|uniref:ABC transporter permease n=1 Tax=Cellulomonas sp. URHD0024 TaxID=1302620 RepID=UPI000406C554|nr:ABC transporter permease [Cellulomonas sp. URHD0024]
MSSTTANRGWARTHGVSRALGRTLAVFVPVFFLGTFITFALRQLSGLSPAHLQLGESATPEKVAQLEAQWGLDEPFLTQYWHWLESLLHGDLGMSWVDGTSISSALVGRAIISLSIAGLALVIGVTVGFALGTLAALWQTTWVDRAITGFTTVISVMPSFVVGIALVAVFAVTLGWFPSAGYVPISQGLTPWFEHIWLPALAISFDTIADVARQLRSGLIGAYRENYVTGAIVRGLGPRRIFFVHVLRNGIGPALTVLGMKFPNLLGGAVVTEAIFGLAGYGKYAADSAQRGDVPAVQGVLVVSIVVVVVFNLLVNTALVRITPASSRGV